MTDITFLEIFQSYILPAVGTVGGLAALIIFLLSKPQRTAEVMKAEAEAKKAAAEANHTISITEVTLQKLITEAAAKAIEGQRILIDDLQERLKEVTKEIFDLREMKAQDDKAIRRLEVKLDRLESELGLREAKIVALEEKLKRYEAENQEYRKENEGLKRQIDEQTRQIEDQRKRIKELEDQIGEIKRKYQERGNG